MEDSTHIAALALQLQADTTAWNAQREELFQLERQLETAKEKVKMLCAKMLRTNTELNKAMTCVETKRGTSLLTADPLVKETPTGVSEMEFDVAAQSANQENMVSAVGHSGTAAAQPCPCDDVQKIQETQSDGDESHSEKGSDSELSFDETAAAEAPVSQNDRPAAQAEVKVTKVASMSKSERGFLVSQFLLRSREQVCAILTTVPRTPPDEVLRIDLEEKRATYRVPDHIKQQYGIVLGVQGTQARRHKQNFNLVLDGVKLSSKNLGIDAHFTNFEDPRDASNALQMVQKLYDSFLKQHKEEEGASSASSSPQKRVCLEDWRDKLEVMSTPSSLTSPNRRTPRASAKEAKQNMGQLAAQEDSFDLDDLKKEHKTLRPVPLLQAIEFIGMKKQKQSKFVDQVVSYRENPNHWQLFRIAECDFARKQMRLKNLFDNDANPPPANFIDAQHVFGTHEIGLRDGYFVCIECGVFDEREKEDGFEPNSVQCEGCSACFHFKCAGIVPPLPQNRHWICYLCTQERKHLMNQPK